MGLGVCLEWFLRQVSVSVKFDQTRQLNPRFGQVAIPSQPYIRPAVHFGSRLSNKGMRFIPQDGENQAFLLLMLTVVANFKAALVATRDKGRIAIVTADIDIKPIRNVPDFLVPRCNQIVRNQKTTTKPVSPAILLFHMTTALAQVDYLPSHHRCHSHFPPNPDSGNNPIDHPHPDIPHST